MTRDERIVAGITGTTGVLLVIATPKMPRDLAIIAWLCVGTFTYGFAVYKLLPKYRRRRMTAVVAMFIGGVLGAVAGLVGTIAFPPDTGDVSKPDDKPDAPAGNSSADNAKEEDFTALMIPAGSKLPMTMLPLPPDPSKKPADPNDLEFYFAPLSAAAFGNWVQYAGLTVTNRSPRKMHLEIWGKVDYWKDDGTPQRWGAKAEWNPTEIKKDGTGKTEIDFEPFETKKGRLILFLGEPEKHGIAQWFLDPGKNVYFEVFDAVTGKGIAFRALEGYPGGQMPSPLPGTETLLKIDFPKTDPNLEPNDAAPALLELVARTRDLNYRGTKANLEVLFTSQSDKPMELEISILIRSKTAENTWRSIEGLFKDSDVRDSVSSQTLSIEPGATVKRRVAFDLAVVGIPSTGGWALREQPTDTLLEISDLQSGHKVWCAIGAGYPPGADLRSTVILQSPDNSKPNSSNTPPDEPNDTK